MPTTRNVAVLLFPDVELLDFAGPFEVFSVASRWLDTPAFNVYVVAEKPGLLVAKIGVSVNPITCLPTTRPQMFWSFPVVWAPARR